MAKSSHVAAGVFSVGDVFYERCLAKAGPGRVKRAVREWRVLAVYVDPDYTTEDDVPIQIALLRAWSDDENARYVAQQDWRIESSLDCGSWSREHPKDWAQ